MARLSILIAILLPTLAAADAWKWRDASGVLHYSNVAAPRGAVPVRGRIGIIGGDLPRIAPAEVEREVASYDRIRQERAVRDELAGIENFDECMRARQIARLVGGYPNVQLLPDWLVADRWLRLHDLEGRLRATLIRLDRRKGGVS
jgi:hypothetical protein